MGRGKYEYDKWQNLREMIVLCLNGEPTMVVAKMLLQSRCMVFEPQKLESNLISLVFFLS